MTIASNRWPMRIMEVGILLALLHIPFDSASNFDDLFFDYTGDAKATEYFHIACKWAEQMAELGAEVAFLFSLVLFYRRAKQIGTASTKTVGL